MTLELSFLSMALTKILVDTTKIRLILTLPFQLDQNSVIKNNHLQAINLLLKKYFYQSIYALRKEK